MFTTASDQGNKIMTKICQNTNIFRLNRQLFLNEIFVKLLKNQTDFLVF